MGSVAEVNETSSLINSTTSGSSQRNGGHSENTPLLKGDESNKETEKKGSDFKFSGLSSKSKYTLLLCCMANLFVGCSFAILAPFFPKEAAKKGVSTAVVGLIFSTFELFIFVSSPLYGNYMTRIGPKFMFTAGICVGGCCSILFGLLDKCPPGDVFVAMCFACRSVEALAMSAFVTASFAILSNEFPNHIATVIGISETASGIGMMIGPAVGGGLYELGGYGLPFFVLGGLIIVNGLGLTVFLPPPQEVVSKRKGSVFRFLRSPIALISMLSIIMCSLSISFIDPTLAAHLDPFDLSTALVGLMFVIAPMFYALLSPLWGYLVDTKQLVAPLLVFGHLFYGLGFFFVGPSPWFPFLPSTIWIIIIGLVLVGVSIGGSVVPNMKCLVIGAQEVGFEDNLDTYGIVAGLFNSMFCLGAFMGPTVGGVLVDHIGFDASASYAGLINIVMALIAFTFFTIRRSKSKNKAEAEPSKENGIKAEEGNLVVKRNELTNSGEDAVQNV